MARRFNQTTFRKSAFMAALLNPEAISADERRQIERSAAIARMRGARQDHWMARHRATVAFHRCMMHYSGRLLRVASGDDHVVPTVEEVAAQAGLIVAMEIWAALPTTTVGQVNDFRRAVRNFGGAFAGSRSFEIWRPLRDQWLGVKA